MGAGRKSKIIRVPSAKEKPSWSSLPGNMSASARNLRKSDLAGAIFGCKHSTMEECHEKKLFGLPSAHFSFVRKIKAGLPLFLFNYSDRKLHGIYEAASPGHMCIDPYAWTEDGEERTPFPAQVSIRFKTQCQPLMEKQYSEIIKSNYYADLYFWFELDHAQTKGLMALFETSTIPPRPVMHPPFPSRKANMIPSSSSSKKGKETANSKRVNSGSGQQKWDPKPLANANKYAALGWGDDDIEADSSSQRSTIDPEEGENRVPASGWEDSVGEDVQGNYSDFCTHPDWESETGHGSWSKMPTIAPEEPGFECELDWEGKVQGIHIGVSPYSNKEEFNEPTSDFEVGWSEKGSHSGVMPYWDGVNQMSLEQQSGVEGYEAVLQQLQKLKAEREHLVSSSNDSDMPGDVHEESRLSDSEELVIVEENTTPPNLSGDVNEESRLQNESFTLAEKQENPTTSDLHHGNSEVISDSEELVIAEENTTPPNLSRDVHEESKLQNESFALAEKQENPTTSDLYHGNTEVISDPKELVTVEENTTPPNLSRDVHEESRLQNKSFALAEKQNPTTSNLHHGNTELVHIIKELMETVAELKTKQESPNSREFKNRGSANFEDDDTIASGSRARASTQLPVDSEVANFEIEGESQHRQLNLGEESRSRTPCSDRCNRGADTTTSWDGAIVAFSEAERARAVTCHEAAGCYPRSPYRTVGVRVGDPYSVHHATKLLDVIPDLPIELFVKAGERIIADPGFREFFISVNPDKRRQLLDHMI